MEVWCALATMSSGTVAVSTVVFTSSHSSLVTAAVAAVVVVASHFLIMTQSVFGSLIGVLRADFTSIRFFVVCMFSFQFYSFSLSRFLCFVVRPFFSLIIFCLYHFIRKLLAS